MNICLRIKIKRELKALKEFKKTFKFEMKEITDTKKGKFCDGFPLEDKNGKLIGHSDTWINTSSMFGIDFPISRLLSNLFPYTFTFRKKEVASIEAVLQGIKFPNKKEQTTILNSGYSGITAYLTRYANPYDWRKTGILYWQGKPMVRESKEYWNFIDELYISAIQNPLFRGAIINSGDKYIMHSIGHSDPKETVLMRCELEYELNLLQQFLKTRC